MPTLYERVYDYKMLEKGFRQTQIGSRKYKYPAYKLAEAKEMHLAALWRALRDKTWRPGPYSEFYVYEPKERLIHAPRTIDKIVQYSAHQVLMDIYGPVYIKYTYAGLDGRGTHKAVDRIQHMMRAAESVQALTYRAFEPYIFVAVIYYLIVMILVRISKRLEKKLREAY